MSIEKVAGSISDNLDTVKRDWTNEQIVARVQAGEDVANNMAQLWRQNRGMIYAIANR